MNGARGSGQPSLDVIHLFWEYAKHTLLTGGIYGVLVIFVLILNYFADLTKNSKFHYNVLVFLERSIFVIGSSLLFLVMIYVTGFFLRDLYRSFRSLFPLPPPKQTGPT